MLITSNALAFFGRGRFFQAAILCTPKKRPAEAGSRQRNFEKAAPSGTHRFKILRTKLRIVFKKTIQIYISPIHLHAHTPTPYSPTPQYFSINKSLSLRKWR